MGRPRELPPTIVMVDAPRDHDDRAITHRLLRAAYDFARGATAVTRDTTDRATNAPQTKDHP